MTTATKVDGPVSEQCCGKQFKMASDQLVTFSAVTYVARGDICIEVCNQLIWLGSTDLCIVFNFISFGALWSNLFIRSLLVSTVRVDYITLAFRFLREETPLTGNCVFK